jgi:hypothetical protein
LFFLPYSFFFLIPFSLAAIASVILLYLGYRSLSDNIVQLKLPQTISEKRERVCAKCNKTNLNEAKFCVECGELLDEEE